MNAWRTGGRVEVGLKIGDVISKKASSSQDYPHPLPPSHSPSPSHPPPLVSHRYHHHPLQIFLKKWEDDKIEDADLYALDTLFFEGVLLSPIEKQTRFRELHNQAVAAGLQQFKAK